MSCDIIHPNTTANLSTFIHHISCFLLPVLSCVQVIKEIAPSAVRPTPVRNIIQTPPIPSQAAAPAEVAAAASPPPIIAASANTVENATTPKVNSQPAAPSPHRHTTMAAPQPMPSEELPALPSTEMRDALLAAAKWAEKAHAPPPATVLEEVREAWSENERLLLLAFMSMWCVWVG